MNQHVVSMACCGMCELHGVRHGTPEVFVKTYKPGLLIRGKLKKYDEPVYPYASNPIGIAMFTDHRDLKYGDALAAFIKTNKLGTVTKTGRTKNPNTGNWIRAYFWKINHKNLRAWK